MILDSRSPIGVEDKLRENDNVVVATTAKQKSSVGPSATPSTSPSTALRANSEADSVLQIEQVGTNSD